MKRVKRGALTGLLSLTIMAMLAGCGGNTKAGEPAGSDAVSPGKSNAAGPVTIKMMANYDSPELSVSDKKFVEQLEAVNNVKLELDIPPNTGYVEKLQLMLASGDYPDLVYFPDTKDVSFRNAVKEGILIPVNDYISKESDLQKYTYQSEWDSLKVNQDENIYGIPRTSILRNDGFWVRADWLKNLNITIPADGLVTIEQFEDILTEFTLNDPDQNNKQDTYGYSNAVNANKVFDPILTGVFGNLGWQETANGPYKYIDSKYDQNSTSYKDALAFTTK
ncbi:MAG: extracellular solute-binding protein, partial [Gorillibacterium sp.]|nr:extracellular solute-binding protein [Gorillibacterium sp.]